MQLSPVSLFVYNRPAHTKQTLKALEQYNLANNLIVYIYADGAKDRADKEQLSKIAEVRKLIRQKWKFKEINIIERDSNWGLAKNISEGVTQVLKEHNQLIVLEDDIVVSKGFINYMHEALELYKTDQRVGCIHGWNYHLDTKDAPATTFFLHGADCWGWATWKRAWDLFESDGKKLLAELKTKNLEYKFNRRDLFDYSSMLEDQINGKNNSWAVRWHASLVLNNMYCLHPTKSLVNNIGLDGTGVHSGKVMIEQRPVESIILSKIDVQESEWFYKAYNKFLSEKDIKTVSWKSKLKRLIKLFIPPVVWKFAPKKKNYQPILWEGKFEKWPEAAAQCKGYNQENILEQCKNALLKVKNGEAVYERDSVLFDKITYSWPLLSGLLLAINDKDVLNVLDFGGSLGSSFFQNRKVLLKKVKLNWCIVEQEKFVKCGKQFFEDDELSFHYSIDDAVKYAFPDVLLFCSVLQYLEDPFFHIKKLIEKNISFVIVDRTAIVRKGPSFITIQHVPEQIYSASYPSHVFNFTELLDQFVGYELIADFNSDITLPTLINGQMVEWVGFILKKKQL